MTTSNDAAQDTDKVAALPLQFYHKLLQDECLQVGYFPAEESAITLGQAQTFAAEKIFSHLPAAPARILLIGPATDNFLPLLRERGYAVDSITRSAGLIADLFPAEAGKTFEDGSQKQGSLPAEADGYNAIVLIAAARIFRDYGQVFEKINTLLAPGAFMLMCEEVCYSRSAEASLVFVEAREIEKRRAELGYYHSCHEVWTASSAHTYALAIAAVQKQSSSLLELFNAESVTKVMQLTDSWQQLLAAYSNGSMGYEFWVLHPGTVSVRNYQPNDEHAILAAFNAAFHVQRSLAHWQWKYLRNPYGQAWISTAWAEDKVVAHYAGYPVHLYMEHRIHQVCQGADVFTVLSHRKVGHGITALMSRTFYHWERQYCEHRIPLAFGFNTQSAQKMGKLLWQHEVIAPVYQHKLSRSDLKPRGAFSWFDTLRGYKVVQAVQAGLWADELFERVKDQYGWLVLRDQTYLNWRYAQHPDFTHEFFVVYHRHKVVGWIVGRQKNSQWLWGDALFDPVYVKTALPLALDKLMAACPSVAEVDSWFAEVPVWWNKVLAKQGFIKQRQLQQLDIIAKFYESQMDVGTLARHLYFTWGDSDLF